MRIVCSKKPGVQKTWYSDSVNFAKYEQLATKYQDYFAAPVISDQL